MSLFSARLIDSFYNCVCLLRNVGPMDGLMDVPMHPYECKFIINAVCIVLNLHLSAHRLIDRSCYISDMNFISMNFIPIALKFEIIT